MNLEELDRALKSPDQFKEIWLRGAHGASLCALINGDMGWLMYLRPEGDPGFSSRNPDITSEESVEFLRSNGQMDFYPKSWTYPVDSLAEAMKSFIQDGRRPLQLQWHEDG